MDEDLKARLSQIAIRRGGHVLVRPSAQPENPRDAADGLARSLHFHPLGDAWKRVDIDGAVLTLVRLLHRWLAYPEPFMPALEASALATEFVGAFGTSPVCFTNVDWHTGTPRTLSDTGVPAYSWQPATESTFDAGVVCVGAGLEGLLWFEEED